MNGIVGGPAAVTTVGLVDAVAACGPAPPRVPRARPRPVGGGRRHEAALRCRRGID